jgi:hypothetical protein
MAPPATCWEPELLECVRVQTLARVTERVSSLAAAPDGRLFFVEGENRLRQITSTGLAVQPLIVADASSTRLNQVAVDPSFLETGFIWVSETQTGPEGLRTFSVVRYRVVGNAVTERAAIVSGIVLPDVGDAVFAIDDSAHIYVAVPASADAYDPYWGMVLRFTPDGLIPADSQTASAVLTAGYKLPSAIAAEPSSNRVWVSGVDQPPHYSVLSVLPHNQHYDLLRVRGDGVLERVSAAHVNSSPVLSLDPTVWGFPLAASAGPGEQIYLALYTSSAFSPVAIVRLLPVE